MRRIDAAILALLAGGPPFAGGCVLTTEAEVTRRGGTPLDDAPQPLDDASVDGLVFGDAPPLIDVAVGDGGLAGSDAITPDVPLAPDASMPTEGGWTRETVPLGDRELLAVWVNPVTGVVWVGGARGALARRDPMSGVWTDLSIRPIRAATGESYEIEVQAISGGAAGGGADEVWLATAAIRTDMTSTRRGLLLVRAADPALTRVNVRWAHTDEFGGAYLDVAHDIAWAASRDGLLWRVAGASTGAVDAFLPTLPAVPLGRVAGPLDGTSPGLPVWAVGRNATLVTADPTSTPPDVRAFEVLPFRTAAIRDVTSADTTALTRRAMVAGGEIGVVSEPQFYAFHTAFELRGVFLSSTDVVAVGNAATSGAIVRIVGPATSEPRATVLVGPPDVQLNDVDGIVGRMPAGTDVLVNESWAVGTHGTVLHFRPGG